MVCRVGGDCNQSNVALAGPLFWLVHYAASRIISWVSAELDTAGVFEDPLELTDGPDTEADNSGPEIVHILRSMELSYCDTATEHTLAVAAGVFCMLVGQTCACIAGISRYVTMCIYCTLRRREFFPCVTKVVTFQVWDG